MWTLVMWKNQFQILDPNWQPLWETIPENWQINPSAPYLRPRIPYTVKNESQGVWRMVDGVKSEVIDYTKRQQLGHIFMFDIDEKIPLAEVIIICEELVHLHDLTHLIITETNAGYHIWSTEIKLYKTEWFDLFMSLKNIFKSDYEFMSNWILRVGKKDQIPIPQVVGVIINEDTLVRDISKGHLFILYAYSNLNNQAVSIIIEMHNDVNTFVDMIKYKSWNFPSV